MKLLAYGLRSEYEGTVDVETEDGHETRPVYGGGVLAVGDGDFNVGEALEAGDGTIVVKQSDQPLIDLLEAYVPLKRVGVPEGDPVVISPYVRRSDEQLRHLASLRDIDHAGSATVPDLIAALDAQDEAIHAGDTAAAADVDARDADDTADDTPPANDDDVRGLTVDAIAAVVDNDTDAFAGAGDFRVDAAIDELRRRAADDDAHDQDDARAALDVRDISTEGGDR